MQSALICIESVKNDCVATRSILPVDMRIHTLEFFAPSELAPVIMVWLKR